MTKFLLEIAVTLYSNKTLFEVGAIFNFNKNKEFREERINIEGNDIFQVYV